MGIYLFLVCIVAITLSATSFLNIKNHHIISIYTYLEPLLIVNIYRKEFANRTKTLFLLLFAVIWILLVAVKEFHPENLSLKITQHFALSCSIVTCALHWFYLRLKLLDRPKLLTEGFFYINIAFLIYFSGTIFIFMFSTLILKSTSQTQNLWLINSILNIILNILLAKGIWLQKAEQTSTF